MTEFPSFHYPSFVPPREEGSKIPDSFGCLHACSVQCHGGDARPEFHHQYCTNNPLKRRLVPVGSCVPFLPPNEGSTICPASYHDYVRKAGTKHALVVNVEQQAEYCYKHCPELTFGPLLEVLSADELPTLQNDISAKKTGKMKESLSDIIDGITSVGVQRPLLHDCLEEEIKTELQKMYHDESFYGGCLSYEWFPHGVLKKHGYAGLLVYPSGPLLDTVNIHAMEVDHLAGSVPTFKPTLSQYQFNAAGCIKQIDSHRLPYQGSILAGIRTEYRCYVLKSEMKKDELRCKLWHDLQSQHRITSLSLSPHIYGEFVFTCENGEAHVVNDKTKVLATSAAHKTAAGKTVPIYGHFGAHPRQLVAHCRQQLYQLDFRDVPKEIPLFCLPNPSLPKDQYFCVAKQHPSNHFYHFIATQHYVMLVDERFPGYTVLQWPHQLSSPPNYLSVTPYLSSSSSQSMEDLLLVSNHSSRETHCFQYSSLLGNTPEATSVPWKIRDYNAWLDSMSALPSRSLKGLRKRLERPLVGMCATKLESSPEGSVTVFEISAAGDIFHQVLKVTDSVDADSKLNSQKLDELAHKRCQEFVERALEQKPTDYSEKNTDIIPAKRINCKETWKRMVQDVTPLEGCSLCNHGSSTKDASLTTAGVDDSVCLGCGLSLTDSCVLSRSRSEELVLTSSVLPSVAGKRNDKTFRLVTRSVTSNMAKTDLGRRLWDSWHEDYPEPQEVTTPDTTMKTKSALPLAKGQLTVKLTRLPVSDEANAMLTSPIHVPVSTAETDDGEPSHADQRSSGALDSTPAGVLSKSLSRAPRKLLKRKSHSMGF